MVHDDFNTQLKTKLALKAETLKELLAKKQLVQDDLESIKKEIRDINTRYKDRTHPNGLLMEEHKDNQPSSQLTKIMDPAGTKLAIKISEIVFRVKQNNVKLSSPARKVSQDNDNLNFAEEKSQQKTETTII